MIQINQLKLKTAYTTEELRNKVAQQLKINKDEILDIEIARRSIDARKKPVLFYVYSVAVAVAVEEAMK